MDVYSVTLDPAAGALYRKLAKAAGLPVEALLADLLFRLAADLSLEGLSKKN